MGLYATSSLHLKEEVWAFEKKLQWRNWYSRKRGKHESIRDKREISREILSIVEI